MIPAKLLKEDISFALRALIQNKLRSILSLLGITIGIFSIIAVFTFIDSMQLSLKSDVNGMGTNVIYVEKWPWLFSKDYPWWKYMNRPKPTLEELDYVQKKCKNADAVAYAFSFNGNIKYGDNTVDNVTFTSITDDYDKMGSQVKIAYGRYFSGAEFTAGTNAAIIGADVAKGLFGDDNAVGRYVKILGRKVMVVGQLARLGKSTFSDDMDTKVLVPVNFAKTLVSMRDNQFDRRLMVKAREGISNDQLRGELTGVMRGLRHLRPGDDDNFALNESSMVTQNFTGLFDLVALIGWVIGGFSILVGGIGIANIMFVSVKERTALIGIQKSLGAKNYFILLQFIFEAIILSLLGGLTGLLIIFLITVLAGNSLGIPIVLTFSNITLGITISVLIGFISGFIPAYTASQLDPVEAIRSTY